MTKHEDQEKQLDSVTDFVQEQEVDAKKAQQAMSALSANQHSNAASAADQVEVSKEDVDLIVSELEISEELAEQTLRQVAIEIHSKEGSNRKGESTVVAALRKLVTS